MEPKDTAPDTVGDNSSPADNCVAVVPSDSEYLEFVSRAFYVGTGGTITFETKGGQVVTMVVQSGQVIPIRIVRVFATGTTASDILTMW